MRFAYLTIAEALDNDWFLIGTFIICMLALAFSGVSICTSAYRLYADDEYRKMQGSQIYTILGIFAIIASHSLSCIFGIVCVFRPLYGAFLPMLVICVVLKIWVALRMQSLMTATLARTGRLVSAQNLEELKKEAEQSYSKLTKAINEATEKGLSK